MSGRRGGFGRSGKQDLPGGSEGTEGGSGGNGRPGDQAQPAGAERANGGGRSSGGGGRRRGRGGGERRMVPDATFTSYYGRPVVKPAPWEPDIPVYMFLGGVAAGSSLLAAGADLLGKSSLRRSGRLGALIGIGVGTYYLIHDLGRPSRFLNMMRVAKPTSPMSVGTWIVAAYAPFAGLAGVAEFAGLLPGRLSGIAGLLRFAARPAGLAAAATGPGLASYTAVLLTDTATPTWFAARRHLPFVFVGSAAAASGGWNMIGAALGEAGPARKLAVGGAVVELAVEQLMEKSMGMLAEPMHTGKAGALMRASKALTAIGAIGAATLARRSKVAAVASGLALMAGSLCTRLGVFEAGVASAKDPKYTVVPQREAMARRPAAESAQAPAAATGTGGR